MGCRSLFVRTFKLFFAIVLTWALLVLLWFVLPSPVPTDAHSVRALESGKPLYRVYNMNAMSARVGNRGLNYFGMRFQLQRDEDSGSAYLLYGGYEDVLDDVLGTRRPLRQIQANLSLSIPNRNAPMTVSDPISLFVPIMTEDLDLLPPGLATADAVMLSHWLHHHSDMLSMRVRVIPRLGKIQIWPDNRSQNGGKQYPEYPPGAQDPLLSILLSDNSNEITFELPSAPASSSPSYFYPIRLPLLFLAESLPHIARFLIPIALGLLYVLNAILQVFISVCTFILLVLGAAMIFGVFFAVGFFILACIIRLIFRKKQGAVHLPVDNEISPGLIPSKMQALNGDLEAQNQNTTEAPKVGHLVEVSQA